MTSHIIDRRQASCIALFMALALSACGPRSSPKKTTSSSPAQPTTANEHCEEKPTTAEEILARVAYEYRDLDSYEDAGLVLTHWPNKARPDALRFETSFVRPTHFYFSLTSHHPDPALRHDKSRRTLWTAGGPIYRYWSDDPTLREERNLRVAIARLYDASSATSYLIPALLLPALVEANWLLNLEDPKRLDDQTVRGWPCLHLQARDDESTIDLWIDRSDGSIRKITIAQPLISRPPDFHRSRLRTEIVFETVALNGSVPASVFDVDPTKLMPMPMP